MFWPYIQASSAKTVREFSRTPKPIRSTGKRGNCSIGASYHILFELSNACRGGLKSFRFTIAARAGRSTDPWPGSTASFRRRCPGPRTSPRPTSCSRLEVTTLARSQACRGIRPIKHFFPCCDRAPVTASPRPGTTRAVIDTLNNKIHLALADPLMSKRSSDLAARRDLGPLQTSASFVLKKLRNGLRGKIFPCQRTDHRPIEHPVSARQVIVVERWRDSTHGAMEQFCRTPKRTAWTSGGFSG